MTDPTPQERHNEAHPQHTSVLWCKYMAAIAKVVTNSADERAARDRTARDATVYHREALKTDKGA